MVISEQFVRKLYLLLTYQLLCVYQVNLDNETQTWEITKIVLSNKTNLVLEGQLLAEMLHR